MAEKLSITIALEGGKQLEQQLEGIGQAGKKAFGEIEQAATKVGGFKNLKPEEVTQKLKDMGIVGTEAFNKIQAAVASASNWERVVVAVASVEKGFSGLVAAAGSFARALGPIGLAAGAAGVGIVKVMSEAAEAINKVDSEAIKLGISISKFDQLRLGFEKMGSSAGAIGEGIGHVRSEIEKLNLEKIKQAAKELEDMGKRGFGGQGTEQFRFLEEQVVKTGAAAKAARAALESLGATVLAPEAGNALERLGIAATTASQVIPQFVEKMRLLPDSAQRTADAIAVLGPKLGVEFVQALRTGGVAVDAFVNSVRTMTQDQANAANLWEQNSNRMSSAWERFKVSIGGDLLATNTMRELTSILEGLNTLINASSEQWAAAFSNIGQAVVGLLAKLGELEVKLAGAIWDAFTSAGTAAINAVIGALDRLWEKLKGIGAAIAGAFSGGGGTPGSTTPIPGNASGGLIGGRGSGTSDSNLAWVSRGEHIMPARAVQQPGMLALLEALRRSGGNLRGVMDGMGRFAGGGMVPRLPAFAAGGLVGGMPHLGTVDLRTDHGSVRLMAGGSAMEQLSRLATTKRMTSTGKKPGFIG